MQQITGMSESSLLVTDQLIMATHKIRSWHSVDKINQHACIPEPTESQRAMIGLSAIARMCCNRQSFAASRDAIQVQAEFRNSDNLLGCNRENGHTE